jgi:thiamine biosynthesis lipoprotein
VADLLRENGCHNLLVDIGGEVVLQGVNDKSNAWRVGITRPTIDATGAEKELQEVIASNNLCMATSGNYRNFREVNGQKVAHTIDPRTGYPVQHSLLSATVIADDCATADAWATSFMVMGLEKAMEICDSESSIEAYLIYSDDNGTLQVAETEGMKKYY